MCVCCRISYACLVVLLCVVRASELGGEDVLMALCLVLGWSNVMFFARGFQMLGPYVIMIQKVCSRTSSTLYIFNNHPMRARGIIVLVKYN